MSKLAVLKSDETTTFYKIAYTEGGGVIPVELQGQYTAHKHAQAILDIYLAKRAARTPEEKPDSEKDIIELLTTKRPKDNPPRASKR